MAYRRIDDNDTIEIRRAQGGNKPETRKHYCGIKLAITNI